MKKILIILLFCTGFIHPNFSNEKIQIKPNIQKGDRWKVVISTNNEVTPPDSLKNSKFYKKFITDFMTNAQQNALSEWQIECIESTVNELTLKATILRVKIDHYSAISENHFDSDYPLNLSDENISSINNMIGKSITSTINFETHTDTIINDELKGKMALEFTSKLNPSVPKSNRISLTIDMYEITGQNMLNLYNKIWQSNLPSKKISIGDSWDSQFSYQETTAELSILYKNDFSEFALFKETQNDTLASCLMHKETGLPFVTKSKKINSIIYDFEGIQNTSIVGVNFDDCSNVTFDIRYPAHLSNVSVPVKNGQFKLRLDLKDPIYGTLSWGDDNSTDLFLTPGMQLKLNWDIYKLRPNVSGYGARDLKCVLDFDDNRPKTKYSKTSINIDTLKKLEADYYELLNSNYGNRNISNDCRRFIQAEIEYDIADLYWAELVKIEREKRNQPENELDLELKQKHKQWDNNSNFIRAYMDTFSLLKDICYSSPAYHQHIEKYLIEKQKEFLYQRGRRYDPDNFSENILFSNIQYLGYPHYYSVFSLLKEEIRKGNHKKAKQELERFAALPCNPAFSNKLNELIEEMKFIDIGQPFPFQEIKIKENETQKIKGGEFTIVFVQKFSRLNIMEIENNFLTLSNLIKTDDRINKINFYFVNGFPETDSWIHYTAPPELNVETIFLGSYKHEIIQALKLDTDYRDRIFLLDKDLKIISNNLKSIRKGYNGYFLPKAIDEYFDNLEAPTSKANTRKLILVILISLVGFGSLSWGVIKLRTQRIAKREQIKRELAEMELKAIRSQINPHFVFNALGSIQNLINHNKIKNANLYLSRFARLLRMVLNNSNKQLVSMAEEMELLKHYIELEQLRVNFRFEMLIDENIDPELEELPGMLIQPFVENAVIHGITPKGEGAIKVHFYKHDCFMCCEITDDGVGIDVDKNSSNESLAMQLSAKRLNLLNSQSNNKLQLKVENRMESEQCNGTKITVSIPIC